MWATLGLTELTALPMQHEGNSMRHCLSKFSSRCWSPSLFLSPFFHVIFIPYVSELYYSTLSYLLSFPSLFVIFFLSRFPFFFKLLSLPFTFIPIFVSYAHQSFYYYFYFTSLLSSFTFLFFLFCSFYLLYGFSFLTFFIFFLSSFASFCFPLLFFLYRVLTSCFILFSFLWALHSLLLRPTVCCTCIVIQFNRRKHCLFSLFFKLF